MVEIDFQIFTSAIILAALNESLINIFKFFYNDFYLLYNQSRYKKYQKNKINSIRKRILTRSLAILFGICLSVFTKVSIMELFHIPILAYDSDSTNKAFEYLITGLIISRGSNMLYDLIDKVKNVNKIKEENDKNEVEGTTDNDTKDETLTEMEE